MVEVRHIILVYYGYFQSGVQDMDEACVQGEGVISADHAVKCPVTQESKVATPKYVIIFYI